MAIRKGILGFCVGMLVSGCIVVSPASPDAVRQLSREGAEMRKVMLQSYPLVQETRVQRYVNKLGQSVAAKLVDNPKAFTFEVVIAADIETRSLPDNQILISVPAFLKAQDEAQLVSLLAHEVAHIAGVNAWRKFQNNAQATGILDALWAGIWTASVGAVHKQIQEIEADKLSMEATYALGYDPQGLRAFMRRIRRQELDTYWGRVHPISNDRLVAMGAYLDARKMKHAGLKRNPEEILAEKAYSFPRRTYD